MGHDDLTTKDYENILNYYGIPIPKSLKMLRTKAEGILADKLCRCISKVSKSTGEKPVASAKAIGVCTRTVIGSKGYTRGKFRCKKPNRSVSLKNTKKTSVGTKKRGSSVRRASSSRTKSKRGKGAF